MRKTNNLLETVTKRLVLSMVGLFLAASLYAAYCGILIYFGNFHTVSEGELYRSAQLSSSELTSRINKYHIRSVINLRGRHPGERWYDEELSTAEALGVSHFDASLSAYKAVSTEQANELVDILRKSPKPILVHCQSGSDRAGLASALFLYALDERSPKVAERQLSLWFGHFPYLTSKSRAMDESFERYVTAFPNNK